jgi:hypothetical protein
MGLRRDVSARRWRRGSQLRGAKAAFAMGAVAERSVPGLSAAAKRHELFARRDRKFISEVIHHSHRALHNQRPVLATADRQDFGHEHLVLRLHQRCLPF